MQKRIILAYKNFRAHCGVSHIGLGVAAINNAKTLREAGYLTEVVPLKDPCDLRKFLNLQRTASIPVTHVVVSAPWIPTHAYSQLCHLFPEIQFAMNCHSNVGFLQADRGGIRLIREGLGLEAGTHNFHVGGNSQKFCRFVQDAYGHPCLYLPNLYFLDHLCHPHRPLWNHTGGILKIGAFGATRSQKNFLSAIAAAIEVSRDLKAQTEIWVSTEREDSLEAKHILMAGKAMLEGLHNIHLRALPWAPWPLFRKAVGTMHILFQPSYTESFNMVTADGIAEGVASVVSNAITWAPPEWKADVDDVFSIARKAVNLLHDPMAAKEGLHALKKHNDHGIHAWKKFL